LFDVVDKNISVKLGQINAFDEVEIWIY